jgi:hypothetical protein
MSGKPGGYVGQDFGELSRAAVLDGFADRPCHVSLRFVPHGQNEGSQVRSAWNQGHR